MTCVTSIFCICICICIYTLAACCGFDLCHKYILYLYLYLYTVYGRKQSSFAPRLGFQTRANRRAHYGKPQPTLTPFKRSQGTTQLSRLAQNWIEILNALALRVIPVSQVGIYCKCLFRMSLGQGLRTRAKRTRICICISALILPPAHAAQRGAIQTSGARKHRRQQQMLLARRLFPCGPRSLG